MRQDISAFLKTVYLGDRGLKGIRLDTWDDRLALQVDCISRVRSETWNFYSDEDIEDGLIVFDGVQYVAIEPVGVWPNGYIDELAAEPRVGQAGYQISCSVEGFDLHCILVQVTIRFTAQSICLVDPADPDTKITD